MLLRFLRLFLALLLSQILLVVLFLFGLGAGVTLLGDPEPRVKPGTGLWIRIAGELIEYPTLPEIPILHDEPISQTAILEGLRHATLDDHITAVLLDLEAAQLGWGKAAELRAALERYRESGKQAWAYAARLDEIGLYLASACDSIYLPPHGKLHLNGMAFGALYYKGLFDKVGVRAHLHRIGAYKDAAEPYLRTGMSDASRQQMTWLLDEIWEEFLRGVTEGRKIERTLLEQALARGSLQPEEAVAQGLIDGVRHLQDLTARFDEDAGKPRLVAVERYRKTEASARGSSHGSIAVVHTRGFILPGKNSYNPVFGTILGQSSVVRDLKNAAADDRIAAIVLRIDSPGGEIVASDVIGHAVERVRRVKPIVVSMVDVAASGGYMMAYRADRIVALPTTITGSIGSITGKLAFRDLYTKLGLHKDFVTRGRYPLLYSDYHDWTAQEESLVVHQHWRDYDNWIAQIASSRKLAVADVDSVARGRVWTGRQALDRGLVDEIGDQNRAVELAAELAGLEPEISRDLVHYPKEMGLLELLQNRSILFSSLLEQSIRSFEFPKDHGWAVLELEFLP